MDLKTSPCQRRVSESVSVDVPVGKRVRTPAGASSSHAGLPVKLAEDLRAYRGLRWSAGVFGSSGT